MNEEQFFTTLEKLRLSQAGKGVRQSLNTDPEPLWLQDLLAYSSPLTPKNWKPVGETAISKLILAWKSYFNADYAAGARTFLKFTQEPNSWTRAWAIIGLAKCLTDSLQFKNAADWLLIACAIGRRSEHKDLMARAFGAIGEVLLRSGLPQRALDAFLFDEQLLPYGDRYKGRVMCYKAHAYSRISGAVDTANYAYQLAAHIPGEKTSGYALGGLALLGVNSGRKQLLKEATAGPIEPGKHPGAGWITTAQAYQKFQDGENPREYLKSAYDSFPEVHRLERRWLISFSIALGYPLHEVPGDALNLSLDVPGPADHRDCRHITRFEESFVHGELIDYMIDDDLFSSNDHSTCWKQREVFMP
jgi:hypothetical protein